MNRHSIVTKIFFPFVLTTIMFAIVLLGVVPDRQAKILTTYTENELYSIAKTIALTVNIALEKENLEALAEFNTFLENDAHISVAGIFVDNGDSIELLAAFPSEVESELVTGVDSIKFLVARAPFKTSNLSGHIEVGFSRKEVANRLQAINLTLYIAFIAILILQIIVYRIVRLGVIKPILASVRSADALGAGKLDTIISKPSGQGEIAQLLGALIQLRNNLKDQKAKNEELTSSLERKVLARTEELSSALQAKDAFVSAITHELRTPLHSIVASLDLISTTQRPDDIEARQYVSVAKSSSKTLLSLINELLDFQKTVDRDLQLVSAPFQLFSLFQQSSNMSHILFEGTAVNFKPEFKGDEQLSLVGDTRRITQVITNIVGNARKFTKQGEVSMTVDCQPHSSGGFVLRFKITDSGIGMDQNTLTHLGESFFQGTTGFNREFGGTGLGLSIVKQILFAMNSELVVESTLGVGSSFSFELRLPEADSARIEEMQAIEPDTLPLPSIVDPELDYHGNGSLKVLYVEDADMNRLVMKAMVNKFSADLTMAESALEGLKLARENRFDLIITDIQMPFHTGIELRQWLADDDEIHSPNIIAFTANAEPTKIKEYIDIGFDDVITKPLTLAKFGSFLKPYLDAL